MNSEKIPIDKLLRHALTFWKGGLVIIIGVISVSLAYFMSADRIYELRGFLRIGKVMEKNKLEPIYNIQSVSARVHDQALLAGNIKGVSSSWLVRSGPVNRSDRLVEVVVRAYSKSEAIRLVNFLLDEVKRDHNKTLQELLRLSSNTLDVLNDFLIELEKPSRGQPENSSVTLYRDIDELTIRTEKLQSEFFLKKGNSERTIIQLNPERDMKVAFPKKASFLVLTILLAFTLCFLYIISRAWKDLVKEGSTEAHFT